MGFLEWCGNAASRVGNAINDAVIKPTVTLAKAATGDTKAQAEVVAAYKSAEKAVVGAATVVKDSAVSAANWVNDKAIQPTVKGVVWVAQHPKEAFNATKDGLATAVVETGKYIKWATYDDPKMFLRQAGQGLSNAVTGITGLAVDAVTYVGYDLVGKGAVNLAKATYNLGADDANKVEYTKLGNFFRSTKWLEENTGSWLGYTTEQLEAMNYKHIGYAKGTKYGFQAVGEVATFVAVSSVTFGAGGAALATVRGGGMVARTGAAVAEWGRVGRIVSRPLVWAGDNAMAARGVTYLDDAAKLRAGIRTGVAATEASGTGVTAAVATETTVAGATATTTAATATSTAAATTTSTAAATTTSTAAATTTSTAAAAQTTAAAVQSAEVVAHTAKTAGTVSQVAQATETATNVAKTASTVSEVTAQSTGAAVQTTGVAGTQAGQVVTKTVQVGEVANDAAVKVAANASNAGNVVNAGTSGAQTVTLTEGSLSSVAPAGTVAANETKAVAQKVLMDDRIGRFFANRVAPLAPEGNGSIGYGIRTAERTVRFMNPFESRFALGMEIGGAGLSFGMNYWNDNKAASGRKQALDGLQQTVQDQLNQETEKMNEELRRQLGLPPEGSSAPAPVDPATLDPTNPLLQGVTPDQGSPAPSNPVQSAPVVTPPPASTTNPLVPQGNPPDSNPLLQGVEGAGDQASLSQAFSSTTPDRVTISTADASAPIGGDVTREFNLVEQALMIPTDFSPQTRVAVVGTPPGISPTTTVTRTT